MDTQQVGQTSFVDLQGIIEIYDPFSDRQFTLIANLSLPSQHWKENGVRSLIDRYSLSQFEDDILAATAYRSL
jgi:hypothetical protein